jgi:dihydroflavonol-4-reductase
MNEHSTSHSTTTVLVTGATGYIARHVVTQLLDAGYTVRGTARSAASLDGLRRDLATAVADPSSVDRFSLVAADLTADAGWDAAIGGCAFVQHVASPIPSAPPKDPGELIGPARDGTLRVLRAAVGAGVQRVVLTSSIAAVLYGVDRNKQFTEADWSNPGDKRIGAYEQSKTLAERAAWDFMERHATGAMELAVINPGLVLGPMIGATTSTSHEAVRKLMNRDFPACPNFTYAMVDARDVAAAHVAAMTSPSAAGHRCICALDNESLRAVAAILAREYGPKGYRIPTGNLPDVVVRLVAKFDKTAALALNDLSNPQTLDNSRVLALLGRPLRTLDDMVLATAASLEANQLVRPTRRR